MNKYLLYDLFSTLAAIAIIIGYYIYKYGDTSKLNFNLLFKVIIFTLLVVLIKHIHLNRKGKR